MKKIKIGLLPRIIIAIILGIAIGTVFPAPLVRIFVTFNGIFSEFLNFSIPLIIVGLVTVAIADIGKGAGKMLLVTALIAYGATLFSGFLSYFTGVTVFPSIPPCHMLPGRRTGQPQLQRGAECMQFEHQFPIRILCRHHLSVIMGMESTPFLPMIELIAEIT